MILTREGKEIVAIYKQNGDEVDEVKDANGRLVYTNTREITGTLPLSFSSRGKPLSDYRISGNTVQDGTPTPDAPVDVVGCGEKSVNIMPSSIAQTITQNGVTMTCDGLGRYKVSGTAGTGGSVLTLALMSEFTIPVSVEQGGHGCMLLWNNVDVQPEIATLFFMYKGSEVDGWCFIGQNRINNTYIGMGGKKCDAIKIKISERKSASFTFSPEFVDTGTYPKEFEPYGYKLPISSGGGNLFDYAAYFSSTFTAYGKYFDFADIQLTPNTTYTFSTNFNEGITEGGIKETSFIVMNSAEPPQTVVGGVGNKTTRTLTTDNSGAVRVYKRIVSNSKAEVPTLEDFEMGNV